MVTKLSRFVRARWFAPPFGGNVFSKLLLDALKAMEASKAGSPLLPINQPLDLFVTVTDFNGHDQILRLNSPPEVTESEHRITVDFSTRGRTGLADMAELIFAARATASFPGAFPPFSVRELDRLLVDLSRADNAAAGPDRHLPFPFLADGVGMKIFRV
mgnify:CR=1 FL=1